MEGLGLSAHQRLRGNEEHFPLSLMGFNNFLERQLYET